MTAPVPRQPRHSGFTLVELLVVVAILSTVTLLAFSVTPDDRTQLRYHDTRQRLQVLERAILGRLGPAESTLVGGFVADNGDLPADIATLLSKGSLAAQAALSPVFDPQPNTSTCASDGGSETTLSDASALLVKGHRGSYLGGLAFNGRFRDGWGNENGNATADATNFGWSVDTSVAQQLTVASLGADNAAAGSDYAADIAATVRATDWRVPIGGWTVQVFNKTGSDISSTINLSASLLVFINNSSGGYWQQFSSNTATIGCLDGNGDGLVGGAPCGANVDLSFPATQCSLSNIPQGRHLLLLVKRTNASGTSSTDAPYWWTTPTTRPVATQVTTIAGLSQPEARLEIR